MCEFAEARGCMSHGFGGTLDRVKQLIRAEVHPQNTGDPECVEKCWNMGDNDPMSPTLPSTEG